MDDPVAEARQVFLQLMLATAATLESFQVAVEGATDLFNHEDKLRSLAQMASELSVNMRQASASLLRQVTGS